MWQLANGEAKTLNSGALKSNEIPVNNRRRLLGDTVHVI
jgi:hypothetical protein